MAFRILVEHLGPEALKEEIAHRPEHSIEFAVVLLQHALAGREFAILPLLVSSLHDCIEEGLGPTENTEVANAIAGLRLLADEMGDEVCFVISGDLAHLGPGFGDAWFMDAERVERNDRRDAELLATLETANAEALHAFIADEEDARRVCGYPPAYVALEAIHPRRGRTLAYDRFVDPQGMELVSFASVAFYG